MGTGDINEGVGYRFIPFYESADCTGDPYSVTTANLDQYADGEVVPEGELVANSRGPLTQQFATSNGQMHWIADQGGYKNTEWHSYTAFKYGDSSCKKIQYKGAGFKAVPLKQIPSYPFALPLRLTTL